VYLAANGQDGNEFPSLIKEFKVFPCVLKENLVNLFMDCSSMEYTLDIVSLVVWRLFIREQVTNYLDIKT